MCIRDRSSAAIPPRRYSQSAHIILNSELPGRVVTVRSNTSSLYSKSPVAVSYTHLDVYKRQVFGRSFLITDFTAINRFQHHLPGSPYFIGDTSVTGCNICLLYTSQRLISTQQSPFCRTVNIPLWKAGFPWILSPKFISETFSL